jgi:hypothetical protein
MTMNLGYKHNDKVYRTADLPFDLLWVCNLVCHTENMVLRRIIGPKRDEVTAEWRRLHNEEIYALYLSPSGACGSVVVKALCS